MMIKIGTRGSKLALWQAYFVEEKLKEQGFETQIVIIETKGDKILDRSLSKIGSKGVFTEELEEQLLTGKIDIAVHSAKDLQSDLGEHFEVIAFTEREHAHDVLVSFNEKLTLQSCEQFVVGTSSTRRVALLKAYYPAVDIVDMRGNLQTRLRKLEEKQCDALLLAYAGVHRMGYDNLIREHLSLNVFTPAVGQGTVAIEASKSLDENKKKAIRAALNHPETEQCLLAERAFLKTMQGGCSIPVFGLAKLSLITHHSSLITITGGIIGLDGKNLIQETISGENPEKLGFELAKKVLDAGGDKVLAEIRKYLR